MSACADVVAVRPFEPVQDKAFRVIKYDELPSTNDEALAQARQGDPGRLWIVAETQTKGRGRNGRTWLSPRGNLHASLLLIDPAPLGKAPELGFVAGIASAHALRMILDGDQRIAIKWPNDILHGEAKLCGILLECGLLPDGRLACAAGIGINCAMNPAATAYATTSLSAIKGAAVAPSRVLETLSLTMAHWLTVWAAGSGFGAIRTEWLSLAAGLGRRVAVSRGQKTLEGTFITIDATGRLVLKLPSREVLIEAGDVFFSPCLRSPADAVIDSQGEG